MLTLDKIYHARHVLKQVIRETEVIKAHEKPHKPAGQKRHDTWKREKKA